jgi:hypothetical protein
MANDKNTGKDETKRERKTYAPIADDDFAPEVAPSTLTAVLAPTRERDSKPDPLQDRINDTVKSALDAWKLGADGERSFAALLGKDLVVLNRTSPEKVETVKFKIRKAGTKHSATIRFGESGKLDDNGRELVSFAVMTKLPAKPRAKRTAK